MNRNLWTKRRSAESFCLLLLLLLLAFGAAFLLRRVGSFFCGDAATVLGEKGDITRVDFDVTVDALEAAYQYDVDSYGGKDHVGWVELLAYLGAEYGGDFSDFRASDLKKAAEQVRRKGTEKLRKDKKNFRYYYEAYSAALAGMVGEYEIAEEKKYGLKAFSPIAKGFSYTAYDVTEASGSIWGMI